MRRFETYGSAALAAAFLLSGCPAPSQHGRSSTGATAAEDRTGSIRPHIVAATAPPADRAAADATPYGLTRKDYEAIVAAVPTLQMAVPVREIPRQVRAGARTADIRLIGTTADYARMHELSVSRGRFLADADAVKRGNVAAIRDQVAQRLFPEEDPVGKNIRVGEHEFLVVGVIEDRSKRNQADARLQVYIPLTAMSLRIGDQEAVRQDGVLASEPFELSRIEMNLSSLDQIDKTAEIIKNLLDRRHDDETYTVTTSLDALRGPR